MGHGKKLLMASVMASLVGYAVASSAQAVIESTKAIEKGRKYRKRGESYSKYLKNRQIEKRKSK